MVLLLLLVACNDAAPVDDTAPDLENLLEPPPEGTTFQYQVVAGGSTLHWPAAFGDGEYEGEPFTEATLGDFSLAQPDGIRAWLGIDDEDPSYVEVRAIELWGGSSLEPIREYRFSPPLRIHRDELKEDQEQAITPTGEFVINGSAQAMDISGSYTLTNTNDTVDVPYDRLDGCWIYEFDVVERGIPVATQIEVKHRLGLIRAQGLLGFGGIALEEVYEP